jgi:hypothetical protein
MASTLSPKQSEFSADLRPTKPSVDAMIRSADLKSKRLSLGKRAARSLTRFLIIFCIGVAATLAWQSYGDAAREMIANSSPQLGWLAPQAAPLAQTAPDLVAPAAPTAPSADLQQLKEMALGLAAVRQSVDQLAAQLASNQQQMAGDIAKLQAEILAPPPRPAAAPARKPVPLTPLPSAQAPPVR